MFLSELSFCNISIAQDSINRKLPAYVERFVPVNNKESFIIFKEESQFTLKKYFQHQQELSGFSANDSLHIVSVKTDNYNTNHYKYQQYYKGVKIENAQIIFHEKNGVLNSLNGIWINNLNMSITPSISESSARIAALTIINAQKYMWEDAGAEAYIKKLRNDSTATYFPEGKLMLVSFPFTNNPQNFHLAYRFDICAETPSSKDAVYIDACTGNFIKKSSLILTDCIEFTANASTLYNNDQMIIASACPPDYYFFLTEVHVETKDMGHRYDPYYYIAYDIMAFNNNWDDNDVDKTANSAHWGAEMTYNYYKSKYNRYGYNDQGGKIMNYVHYGSSQYNNSGWDKTEYAAFYGDGDGVTEFPLVSLDVVGHEITHGVEQSALMGGDGFDYTNPESGALGESFSDMFGEAVEFYVLDDLGLISSADWIHGGDITIVKNGVRSLLNPKDQTMITPCPDTYQGTNWEFSTIDHYGAHTNCGVGNYWFYLLSEGKQGNIDDDPINQPYCVEGIGIDKAANIAYETLNYYLFSISDYASFRSGSIAAAQSLYGFGSNEEVQVTNAWYAVGIGPEFYSPITLHNRNAYTNEYDKNKNIITAYSFYVQPGNTCTFQSETAIYLENGFHAANGSNFHAFIAPVFCQAHLKTYTQSGGSSNHGNNSSSQSSITKKHTDETSTNLLYPNPNNGIFTITTTNTSENTNTIEIYNTLGNKIYQSGFKTNTKSINISSFPQGIYIVKVYSGNNVFVEKVVYQ